MTRQVISHFTGLAAVLSAVLLQATILNAAEPRGGLRQPVYRVNNTSNTAGANPARQPVRNAHPLDPALRIAYDGLENIDKNIHDYTATLVKRERVNGTLTGQEFLAVKIRNRKVAAGRVTQPLSVYMKFLKPDAKAGREVIWVEGRNNGKLVAHEVPGFRNIISVNLAPDSYLAMLGNRYPITDAGIQNLVYKLIKKGERDRKYPECEVKFYKGAKINDRTCTLLQVMHPVKRDHFDFYIAQIFIDDQLQVPIRYAAYEWPKTPGGKPVLLEEYTYMNIKLNVGLTDADFDKNNKAYKFP